MKPGLLGAPVAPLYEVVTSARRMLYDRGWLSARHPGLPTFSVGGLEVGGTGKTPAARWLLRTLVDDHQSPGLLSRGYGRLSNGLRVRGKGQSIDPDAIGDEPAMIASDVDVPIAACADRIVGARAIASHVNCYVLDDGFSHRRLARDLDIVVLRTEPTPDRMRHLPWGPLREASVGLRRAHVIWFHGPGDVAAARAFAQRAVPGAMIVASRAGLRCEVSLNGRHVLVATGVARPERVGLAVSSAGAKIAETMIFRDHHRFTPRDEARIAERARAHGVTDVVTTAKDDVKMTGWQLPRIVVDVEMKLLPEDELRLRRRLSRFFRQHSTALDDN